MTKAKVTEVSKEKATPKTKPVTKEAVKKPPESVKKPAQTELNEADRSQLKRELSVKTKSKQLRGAKETSFLHTAGRRAAMR